MSFFESQVMWRIASYVLNRKLDTSANRKIPMRIANGQIKTLSQRKERVIYYHKLGFATINHNMMSNNKIYFHTADFNFLISVSKSMVPARNARIFGLNALARNTIELAITTIVIMTHEVVHDQFPCHTSRIPDPTKHMTSMFH